jgi:uncharacterized protein (DUF58 family)
VTAPVATTPAKPPLASQRVPALKQRVVSLLPTERAVLIFASATGVLLLSPIVPRIYLLVAAFDALVLLLVLADFLRAPGMGDVAVERDVEPRLSLGAENVVKIRARNLGRHAARLVVRDDYPPPFTADIEESELSVPAGDELEVRYKVTPHRRGDERFLDLHVESIGPLGLARRAFSVAASEGVKVYPNLLGVERMKLFARRNQLAQLGLHRIRKRGTGGEFEKLRPYVPGDEFRKINWKATARRGRPVTADYETEKSQSVLLLLDAGRRMAPWVEGLTKLDYAVNASLMLSYVASQNDDLVGLAVFSHEMKTFLAPRKGRLQHRRIMERLYACEAELAYVDYRRCFTEIASRVTKRSLVVIFTDVLDPDAARDLEEAIPLLRSRHQPLVVSLQDPGLEEVAERDPEDADELYESLVAREVYADRRRMVHEIERRGVHVLDAHPRDFSVAVVDRYLALKARQGF